MGKGVERPLIRKMLTAVFRILNNIKVKQLLAVIPEFLLNSSPENPLFYRNTQFYVFVVMARDGLNLH